MMLDRAQRDALHQFVVTDLVALGDLTSELIADDPAKAQHMRLCLAQDCALLDRLGWLPGDDRDSYELSLCDETVQALLRLRVTAQELIADTLVESFGDGLMEAVQVVKVSSMALKETDG